MSFFTHPFHPFTVHFPIAFYLLGALLTLVYLWRASAEVERFAYWSFAFSWVATLVACLAGLIDQSQLAVADPRHETVNAHITGAVALLIIPGLLLGAYTGGTDRYFRDGGGEDGGTWDGYTLVQAKTHDC